MGRTPAQHSESKVNAGKGETPGSQMASSLLCPDPGPGRTLVGSFGQINAQKEHFKASEHLNLYSRMERAGKNSSRLTRSAALPGVAELFINHCG